MFCHLPLYGFNYMYMIVSFVCVCNIRLVFRWWSRLISCFLGQDWRLWDHQVTCSRNRDVIFRHDSLRDILFSATISAAPAARKEAPSLILEVFYRPVVFYLPLWKSHQLPALEVTVTSTLQQLTIHHIVDTAGYALSMDKDVRLG